METGSITEFLGWYGIYLTDEQLDNYTKLGYKEEVKRIRQRLKEEKEMNLIYNISKEAEDHLETRGEVYIILNNVRVRLEHLFPDINKVEVEEGIEGSYRIFLLKVNGRPFLDYKLKLDKTQDYLWTQVISDLFTMAIGKFGSAIRLDAGIELAESKEKQS